MRRRLSLLALQLAVIVGAASIIPRWLCGRQADGLYRGERAAQLELAREVAREVTSGSAAAAPSTGSARFDGEWTLVTQQMAVLGLGQVVLEHPELAGELTPAIDAALEKLLTPTLHRFGESAWGERGLEHLESRSGHAYLGYVNLALSLDRLLRQRSPRADLNDRLTAALARRLAASTTWMIETYPGETYPPDVAAVAASIALNDRATGRDRYSRLLRAWQTSLRERYVDERSGLLFQAVRSRDGVPLDRPRASGTAIAAYYLSFADRTLSRELYGALLRNRATLAGFGGVREYAPGAGLALGDIDSGPVLLGLGLSATGFTIGSARTHRDRDTFLALYRTAHLFGAPADRGQGRRFATGGPIGNAIMLAMLTAGPGAAP